MKKRFLTTLTAISLLLPSVYAALPKQLTIVSQWAYQLDLTQVGFDVTATFWAKFLIWISVFTIGYIQLGKLDMFKGNDRQAGVIAAVLASMSAFVPNEIVRNVIQTYTAALLGIIFGILIYAIYIIGKKLEKEFSSPRAYHISMFIFILPLTMFFLGQFQLAIAKLGITSFNFTEWFDWAGLILAIFWVWHLVRALWPSEGERQSIREAGATVIDVGGKARDWYKDTFGIEAKLEKHTKKAEKTIKELIQGVEVLQKGIAQARTNPETLTKLQDYAGKIFPAQVTELQQISSEDGNDLKTLVADFEELQKLLSKEVASDVTTVLNNARTLLNNIAKAQELKSTNLNEVKTKLDQVSNELNSQNVDSAYRLCTELLTNLKTKIEPTVSQIPKLIKQLETYYTIIKNYLVQLRSGLPEVKRLRIESHPGGLKGKNAQEFLQKRSILREARRTTRDVDEMKSDYKLLLGSIQGRDPVKARETLERVVRTYHEGLQESYDVIFEAFLLMQKKLEADRKFLSTTQLNLTDKTKEGYKAAMQEQQDLLAEIKKFLEQTNSDIKGGAGIINLDMNKEIRNATGGISNLFGNGTTRNLAKNLFREMHKVIKAQERNKADETIKAQKTFSSQFGRIVKKMFASQIIFVKNGYETHKLVMDQIRANNVNPSLESTLIQPLATLENDEVTALASLQICINDLNAQIETVKANIR